MAVKNIPYRTMNIYNTYFSDEVIPLIFGYGITVKGLRRSPDTYIVGEGGIDVIEVTVDGEKVTFESAVLKDEYNKTVTLVRLSPVADGKVVSVRANGLRSKRGEVIYRASDVIEHLLEMTEAPGYIDLSPLVEYETEYDIQVRGVLRGGTLHKVLSDIISSVGCFWASHLGSSIMPLRSLSDPIRYPKPLTPIKVISGYMQLSDVINVVEFKYDYNEPMSSFLNSIIVIEESSLSKYHERKKTVENKWIYRHRDASLIARELLRLYAFPQFTASYTVGGIANIGEALEVGEDILTIVNAKIDVLNAVSDVDAIKIIREGESITERITTRAVYEHQTQSVSVVYQHGILTITVTDDETQKPIEDAIVCLDNTTTSRTNQKGEAYFINVSPGRHTIRIEKIGYEVLDFAINL